MTINGLGLLMLLRDVTYTEVSKKLGVSRQMVCMWAKQRKIPTDRISELAEILGCPEEYIVGQIDIDMLIGDIHKYMK